jgi:hypothetical protein
MWNRQESVTRRVPWSRMRQIEVSMFSWTSSYPRTEVVEELARRSQWKSRQQNCALNKVSTASARHARVCPWRSNTTRHWLWSFLVISRKMVGLVLLVKCLEPRPGVNQQPPMHQFRMSPLLPFCGWTKIPSSLPAWIFFFHLFSAPKISPLLPTTYQPLPPSLHRQSSRDVEREQAWSWSRGCWSRSLEQELGAAEAWSLELLE